MARDRTESDDDADKSYYHTENTIDRRSYLKATGTAFAAAGLTAGTASANTGSASTESGYHVSGWYPSWGWWDDYRPSDVPFELLDFISISDFTPQSDGTVEFTYPSIESSVLEEFRRVDRHDANVLVMLGGAGGSQNFADAVSTAVRRERFVETTLEYLRTYDLDGVDVDWEFPLDNSASDAENRRNFTALIELFRERLDRAGSEDGKYYWLTASLSQQPWRAREHDTQRLGELLDFAAIMNYNYAGSWSSATDHNAPLFSETDDGVHDYPPSSHAALQAWIEEGIPAEKVSFGVPSYGVVFEGVSDGGTDGLGQPWSTWGGSEQHSTIAERYLDSSEFETFWDSTAEVPFSYSASRETFVSHETPASVERKCQYVADRGLHGVMFWQIDGDTSDHELLRAANAGTDNRSISDPSDSESDDE